MPNIETLALSGASSTGKSTIADELYTRLSDVGKKVVVISQDSFFKNLDKYARNPDGSIDFESPNNILWNELIECVMALENGQSVQIPIYEKGPTGGRKGYKTVDGDCDIVIIEGHQLYSQESILNLLQGKAKVFLKADEKTILDRRMKSYGTESRKILEAVVVSMNSNIMPLSEKADFVLDTTYNTPKELALEILKHLDENNSKQGIHSRLWWECFWYDPAKNFGPPRKELIDLVVREGYRKEKLTVVDVASGDGRYAISLAKAGCEVEAVELTTTGVERIKKNASETSVTVGTTQGDFLQLSEENRQYDVVVSSGFLEELNTPSDQIKAIKGLQQWTKPNGLLVLKFCLEIKDRGIRTQDNFAINFFDLNEWEIIQHEADLQLRDSIAPIDFENKLRTETIIARKISR